MAIDILGKPNNGMLVQKKFAQKVNSGKGRERVSKERTLVMELSKEDAVMSSWENLEFNHGKLEI